MRFPVCFMPSNEIATWTVSPHAKQRAWERYGVMFSSQKWTDFCDTLQRQKNSIRLGSDGSGSCRFACYFENKWFLVGCTIMGMSGIVSTFLPVDALSDTDKIILQADDRYHRFGNDAWNIMYQKLPGATVKGKQTSLPEMHISQEELPIDFELFVELLEKRHTILQQQD